MKSNINEIITEILYGKENTTQFLDQFNTGFSAELEHSGTVDNNLVTVARIVLDHLEEDPEYYTKLLAAKL